MDVPNEGARRADEGSGGAGDFRFDRTLTPTPLPWGEGLKISTTEGTKPC
jgi:hypothetical protein